MPNPVSTKSFQRALIWLGATSLILTVLVCLDGLMKLGRPESPNQTVEITMGNSTQTLHEPIEASLAKLTFPGQSGMTILVDPHNPKHATVLGFTAIYIGWKHGASVHTTKIMNPSFIGEDGKWILAPDERKAIVESIKEDTR